MALGMRQWLSSWENFTIHAKRYIDVEDGRIVALVELHARARASGAPLVQRGGHLHVFRDGRLARLEIYPNPESALRAAGLDPDSA